MEEYVSSANKARDTETMHVAQEASEYEAGNSAMAAASARSLWGDSRLGERGNGSVRAASTQGMQQTYGNRAVQRSMSGRPSPLATEDGVITRRTDAKPIQRFPGIPEFRDPGSFRPEDEEAGILDKMFDLNPRKTFVESGLEGLLGEKSPAHSQEGDSTLTTLGRAGLSVGAGLLSPFAIFGGEILDTINHPSHLITGPFDRGPSKEQDGTFTPGNDAPLIPDDAPLVG